MKTRRAVFGVIVIVGGLILLVAVSGVLSPKPKPIGAPDLTEQPPDAISAKDFRADGENWTLEAKEAVGDAKSGTVLKFPRLRMKRPSAEGEDQIEVTADSGRFVQSGALGDAGAIQHVELSGNVRITFTGREKALLITERLEASPSEGKARTDEKVQGEVTTDQGVQRLTGAGVEIDTHKRTARVLKDIRIEVAGYGDLFPSAEPRAPAKASPEPAAPKIVTCAGPLDADGFTRTIVLNGDVTLVQGESRMKAARVELRLPERGDMPDRVIAEGDVSFSLGEVQGTCDRFTRSAIQDQVTLVGKPAVVQQAGSRIEAEQIDLEMTTRRISVNTPGQLQIAQPGKESKPGAVRWSRMLNFDPVRHEAVFRGDVQLTTGDQAISCNLLTVKLDEQNREMTGFRAEGDVNVQMKPTEKTPEKKDAAAALPVRARGKELTYDSRKDVVEVSGDAVVQQGQRVIEGQRIMYRPADSSIAVTGAGRMKDAPDDPAAEQPAFDVSWSGAMNYARDSKQATFQRDITLTYGIQKLKADSLVVDMAADNTPGGFQAEGHVVIEDENGRILRANRVVAALGADNKLQGFDATDNVSLTEQGPDKKAMRTLRAARLVARVDEEGRVRTMESTGGVVIEESGTPSADARSLRAERAVAEMTPDGRIERFDASGKVVVTVGAPGRDQRRISAPRMFARVGEDGSFNQFETIGGTVTVETGDGVARGDKLTWDVLKDSGVLTGEPVELKQGENRIYGSRLEFSQKTGSLRMTGAGMVEGDIPQTSRVRPPDETP